VKPGRLWGCKVSQVSRIGLSHLNSYSLGLILALGTELALDIGRLVPVSTPHRAKRRLLKLRMEAVDSHILSFPSWRKPMCL
jgi:hypothetical protein